ncbi:MAG: hypothetical protein ACREUT_20385 [Steroidobacteraceae bacterium]
MALELHTVELPAPTAPAQSDRLIVAMQKQVANASGADGAAVTTTVTFDEPLPAQYVPVVNPGQDATWYVTNRTTDGFDVVLTPRLAANALAAGHFDVAILA